ncbi:3-oxoacyl-[acyl-carrier-protein] synthase III C-terminal domain-containing protein [Sphingomonas naphthae]|uniref:3-oxoacyl-[acyl-carrier-protein] synthase III C-terminal domain-containing protein n=1 Tax=Sphingomonas naphthae TaxID=1813468 RepID=A0ABY7TMP9_9SPHN|nr:3-oxoacyl-[acyl-carrier-protein] synthase III C-terminal domain-containing protein [Sphingomonas naphthae]WCT74497.1 3-oxoacyl-[acyl-carrier-protein] synthase III C-terminal domain-containing protein [Sphingomonas naphthae]
MIDHIATHFTLSRHREAAAIGRRLAIETRYLCRPFEVAHEVARAGQSNPDFAAAAVAAALREAGLAVGDIGYLIGHTTTPLQPLPGNIAFVADRLGYGGPHLELRQACTGFANALMIAFGLLAMPGAQPVAIVGSETGSLFFDPNDADRCPGQCVNLVQMGDGAGAIVLGPGGGRASIEAAWFGAIGLNRATGLQASAETPRTFGHDFATILASGAQLFEAGKGAAAQHGVELDGVDTIIPHQVSGRIGRQAAAHFGLPAERFSVNADRLGNTGSAAIWLALAELRRAGPARGSRTLILGAEATKFMHGGFVYEHG